MKKVLVLAYDFPPYNSIGGQRPFSWLKYFPENNIDITVITRHWDLDIQSPVDYIRPSKNQFETTEILSSNSRIVRVPFEPNVRDKVILKYGLNKFSIVRKLLSFIMTYLRFIIPQLDSSVYRIFKTASKYLTNNRVDYIIASGEPFILFKYANMLSKLYNTPWIADYRDCWNYGFQFKNQKFKDRLSKRLMLLIEKKIVKTATAITTPSPSYKDSLSVIFPSKRIKVIYNGSDIANSDKLNKIDPNVERFEVAYAGTIYEHQKLEVFLDGVVDFINRRNVKVNLVFYGVKFYPDVVERLLSYRAELTSYIEVTERLPYNLVLEKLKKSHVLLLLSDVGKNWLNAKVFDYLALKRPILLCVNDNGILEKILDDSKVGYKASNFKEVSSILEILYDKYFIRKEKFFIGENAEVYTRKNQAIRYTDFIYEL